MASKVYPIRLNDEEYQCLIKKANEWDMKISTYLKSIAIHEAIGKRFTKKADPKLVMLLSNMNGILSLTMIILDNELSRDSISPKAYELLHEDLFKIQEELKLLGDRYDC